MRELLDRFRQARPDEPSDTRVMRVTQSELAMKAAKKKAGIAHLTHHDLRHLFATRCIESGVDIPTVSRWLGHIRMDLPTRSDKATVQKTLSPKGFVKNGPATSLLLSHRSILDMLLRRVRTEKSCPTSRAASSAGHF